MRELRLYLEDIRDACRKVIQYIARVSFDEFASKDQVFDAVVRNLEVIGEAVKQIPDDERELHPEIPWRKIARVRDIIAHIYFGLDEELLWDIATHGVPDLLPAIEDMLQRHP